MQVGVNDGVADGSASGFGEDRRYCNCGGNTEKRHNSISSIGGGYWRSSLTFQLPFSVYTRPLRNKNKAFSCNLVLSGQTGYVYEIGIGQVMEARQGTGLIPATSLKIYRSV